jgi:hypothetical protein
MKVFISWSGEESGAVAQVLRQQLPCIIQAVKPFVSSEDIEKGAAWFQQIGAELEKSDFGILCLTNANQNSKWVQFEAGALAGKFSKARIAPLLIDTTPTAIKPPLSQFQLTDINNKEDFFKLILSINACLGENALTQETLQEIFNNWWNPFNQKVKAAVTKVSKKEAKPVARTEKEILEEILGIVRSLRSPEIAMPGLAEEIKRNLYTTNIASTIRNSLSAKPETEGLRPSIASLVGLAGITPPPRKEL